MSTLKKVFISHSHSDHDLADAFRGAIRGIFGQVDVAFSSDKEAGGGPQAGTSWLDWIHRQMHDCDEALLLLTPYSIQKPWPMWEAGAVAGMALATAVGPSNGVVPPPSSKPVIPIRFNIPESAMPGPFLVTQSFDGAQKGALNKLLGDLMRRHDFEKYTQDVVDTVLEKQVEKLWGRIAAWQDRAPAIVTEGMITEWCARLDRLRDTRRSADVGYLHRWIRLLYEGPAPAGADSRSWSAAAASSRWDIRLHLRLAENYELSGQAAKAIEQYELAAQLAPLDVFVLHKLAKSLLDVGRAEDARRTIDRIFGLDGDALKWNAEVAGLEGRYWKDLALASEKAKRSAEARDRFGKARAAYQAAMNIEGDLVSHYMADNVGQMSLKLGETAAAREAYEKAIVALERVTPETENIWTLATRATAALVLGKRDDALAHLSQIRARSAGESQNASILRGLAIVRDALNTPPAEYRAWMDALLGPERASKTAPDERANAVAAV